MNWPRSRYTRSLEEQIADLRREKIELAAQVAETNKALSKLIMENAKLQAEAAIRAAAPAPAISVKPREHVQHVNWLQGKAALEGTTGQISEREKENSDG